MPVPNGKITRAWIAGEHDFCMASIGAVLELEAKCGVGVREVLGRLNGGTWRIYDATEPIRLGLIGGGMEAGAAMELMKRHVYPPNALGIYALMSAEILEAAIVGVPGDNDLGKEQADRAKEGESRLSTPAADSSDPSFTA